MRSSLAVILLALVAVGQSAPFFGAIKDKLQHMDIIGQITGIKHPMKPFPTEGKPATPKYSPAVPEVTVSPQETPTATEEIPEPPQETPTAPEEIPEPPQETPTAPEEIPEPPQETPAAPVEIPAASQETPAAPEEVPEEN